MGSPSLDLRRVLCGLSLLRLGEGPEWPSSLDSGRARCGSPLLRLEKGPVWLPPP